MVRAVAQIEQEIATLDQTVTALAQAFYEAYQQYLAALGKAMRQQFVLAGYHICTHAYPEQFLTLSLDQQKALQQSLQRLAKQGQSELLDCLTPVQIAVAETNSSSSDDESCNGEEDVGDQEDVCDLTVLAELTLPQPNLSEPNLFEPNSFKPNLSQPSFDAESSDSGLEQTLEPAIKPPVEQLDQSAPDSVLMPSEDTATILTSPESAQASAPEEALAAASNLTNQRLLHPKDIAYWQNHLEEAIVEVLQNLSHTTNCVLQQADILPSRLPEPVLEVAAKADLSSETAASPPNLLNLLIESDGEDEKLTMTQVMAIRLRLSEIEFGDAATAAHRSKLRHLTTQLGKLGREYQRKQKERAVAQAETVWRSSWYEHEA